MPIKKEVAVVDSENVGIAPLGVSKEHNQSYNSIGLPAIAIFLYIMFTLNLVCELLTVISTRNVTFF